MRIAVDARPLAAPLTGIGRYSWELLRELIKNDHEWLLYSSTPLPWEALAQDNVSCRQGKAKTTSLASAISAQVQYSRWMREDRIELFWSPRHHLPLFVPDNVKTAVTIHDVVYRRYPHSMTPGGLSAERLLMPAAIRKADGIICVSNFTRSELSHFWPASTTKSTAIHSGTSRIKAATAKFQQHEKGFILSVGTPEPRKNLPRLLQAFSSLVHEHGIMEDMLIVGGDGWGGGNLQEQIQKLRLKERVRLLGNIDDQSLANLYREARCLVMPSLYEGFGLPVVEAMHYGLPSVISEGGALAEVAGDSGLTCDPLEVRSIATAIEKLLLDQPLREQLGEKARTRSTLFNWHDCAQETLAFLESI